MIETWLPVVDYEGLYEVSDHGRVQSLDREVMRSGHAMKLRGLILKPHVVRNGNGVRVLVTLSKDGVEKQYKVSYLVLKAFVSARPPGQEACHFNDNGLDNSLENLRWDTRSGNRHDRVRNGRDHNTEKDECLNGHKYTPENTIIQKTGRTCRKCAQKRSRDYMRSRRALTRAI